MPGKIVGQPSPMKTVRATALPTKASTDWSPKIEEFKDEFKYYEYTPIEKIIIDEHNLVPFIFFSPEGINYLMPKIIDSISNGIRNDDIPVNIEEFIINIPAAENITHALNL